MVLGTCNFIQTYLRSSFNEKECLDILDTFYESGGRIIDSAKNYASHDVINKWLKQTKVNDVKIITKVWKEEEIDKCFEELGIDHIYCIMSRNSANEDIRSRLELYKKNKMIDIYGTSIYYTHEANQLYNAFHIPANFDINYADTMILHADLFIRSLFNIVSCHNIETAIIYYTAWKVFERPDINHRIYPVIGVSSKKQLLENMRLFK